MALVVFNMSIDPPDLLKNMDNDLELEEDLSINEIESFSELILEKGLDLENAVPETDDPDSDNIIKKVEMFSSLHKNNIIRLTFTLIANSVSFFHNQQAGLLIWPEIFNPPPEI